MDETKSPFKHFFYFQLFFELFIWVEGVSVNLIWPIGRMKNKIWDI